MIDTADLTGHLLIAIPKTIHTTFNKGVVLVTSHWPSGGFSCMINKPIPDPAMTVTRVMQSSGIEFISSRPIFYGGDQEHGRIQIVHSLDWQCASTKIINQQIGVTQEFSILTAIAEDQGPEYWRCVMGHRVSGPGHLDGELRGQDPWTPEHRWLVAPATIDLLFNETGDQQWLTAINAATKLEVSNWF